MQTKRCCSKTCDKAGEQQPVENFYKCKTNGYQGLCKKCKKDTQAAYRLRKGIKPREITKAIRERRADFVSDICGDIDLKAINLADYSNKKVKRALELVTASKVDVKDKGSFLGITGPELVTHYDTFSPNLGNNSVFLVAECNNNQMKLMKQDLRSLQGTEKHKIVLANRDVFDAAETYGYHNPDRKKSFSYVHLDFCTTADTLMDDYGLRKKLKWLGKWSHLRDLFYLDISVCRRNSDMRTLRNFIGEIIPAAFEHSDWRVGMPDVLNYCDREGASMINAFFKIRR